MPRYKYAALDAKGKQADGEVIAADSRQAFARVRELGVFPTGLNQVDESPEKGVKGKISTAEIAQLIRQLANLSAGGLPIHRSLVVLAEQSDNPALRALLDEARADVRAGGALSAAFGRFPKQFPPLAMNMIRTGETTGTLDQSLARLADLMETTLQRRAQITSALIYPTLLIVVAICAVTFLMLFLVPKISQAFKDSKMALPVPTTVLIGFSDALHAYWWLIFPVGIVIAFGMYSLRKREGSSWYEPVVGKLPIAKRLLDRIVAARLARTLGTMLAGGVAILDALEIAGNGAGSRRVERAIEATRDQVREGVPLASALSNVGGFMPVLIHVSAVGEETGNLPDLLTRLADALDFEVDIALKRIVGLLEPAIILIMGGIVGFIVLAMLLPIFALSSTVS